MKIRVLGCNGGIGPGLRTTSMLIDDDVLIDCGSGVGDLTMNELNGIRHIFLTHGHLDHIAFIPFLVDTAFDALVDNPVTVHLQKETMNMLREYIFNWKIWPDFAKLPDENNPVLQYNVIAPGDSIELDGRTINPIAVTHTQAAVGYRVQSEKGGAFAFSGDTKSTDQFWETLNAHPGLDLLFIECAYRNHDKDLGEIAGHHCPITLADDLNKLKHQPGLFITHLKPGEEENIMCEIDELVPERQPSTLQRGQVFEI